MEFRELEWQVAGPHLFGWSESETDLRVHYTKSIDTRWQPWAILSPKVNLIDIESNVAKVNNELSEIRAGVLSSWTMNSDKNRYVYLARGSKLIKWLWDSLTATSETTDPYAAATNLPETCTRMFYSRAANGNEELTLCFDDSAYRVVTAIGTSPTADTINTTPTDKIRIADVLGSDAGVARVLGWGKFSGTANNKIKQNTLSGSVTMASPNWVERATVSGEEVTPTGVNLLGDVIIWETSNGPYYLNSEYKEFRPLFPELPNTRASTESGSGKWSVMGVISPVQGGVRVIRSPEDYVSMGPETYPHNPGPVIGQCTAFAATDKWGLMNITNIKTGHTWCVAMRPSQPEDNNPYPVSYYTLWNSEFWLNHPDWPFVSSSDTEQMSLLIALPHASEQLDADTGFIGGPDAQPEVYVLGSVGTEAFWFEVHHNRPYLSQNASRGSVGVFMTSGQWYGTTYQGAPGFDKYVQWVEIDTENCSSTRTVTVSVQVERTKIDYGSGGSDATVEDTETFYQVGYVIKQDGRHRLEVPPGEIIVGNIIKPKVALATDDDDHTPAFSRLRMRVGLAPRRQDGMGPQRVA